MAKPSTKDGYIPGSYDWLASIFTAGLRDLELIVYIEVCFQIYGLAKLPVAHLSPADIAARTGKQRGNIGKAIAGIVAKNIVKKIDGGYVLVEDHAAWQLGESPEERETRLRYIAKAPQLAKSYFRQGRPEPSEQGDPDRPRQLTIFDGSPPPNQQSCVIHRDNTDQRPLGESVIQRDNAALSNGITSVIQRDNAALSNGITTHAGPIEERARGIENLREKGEGGGEAAPPPGNLSRPGKNGDLGYHPDHEIERKQRALDVLIANMNGRET